MRFQFNQFQLDCLLLGRRSVPPPLIFATMLLFLIHVFLDVCHLCFITGELLVNSLKYVPCELTSSESLVANYLMCLNMEKSIYDVKYGDIVCPYCCLAFIAELFCDLCI